MTVAEIIAELEAKKVEQDKQYEYYVNKGNYGHALYYGKASEAYDFCINRLKKIDELKP